MNVAYGFLVMTTDSAGWSVAVLAMKFRGEPVFVSMLILICIIVCYTAVGFLIWRSRRSHLQDEMVEKPPRKALNLTEFREQLETLPEFSELPPKMRRNVLEAITREEQAEPFKTPEEFAKRMAGQVYRVPEDTWRALGEGLFSSQNDRWNAVLFFARSPLMQTIEESFADHFAAIDWIRENQSALDNRSFAHIMAALSSGDKVNADWRYSAAAAEHALKRLGPIWQELERHWQQLNAKEQLEVLKAPEILTHSHHMECMDLSFMTYLQDESKPFGQRRSLSREYVRSIIIFALRYGGKERIEKLAEAQLVPSTVKSL